MNLQRKEANFMEIDPVCMMGVDPKTAAGKSEYQGKTYYFCSLGCKKDFDKEPQSYANAGIKADDHGSQHKHAA
jgi:Cu+-exporting ATPase